MSANSITLHYNKAQNGIEPMSMGYKSIILPIELQSQVAEMGVEPIRSIYEQQILSLPCLPIPPLCNIGNG
jgi:hypothetical protein